LLANTSMDTDKIKIFGAKIKTSSLSQLAKIETEEKKENEKKNVKKFWLINVMFLSIDN